MSITVKLPCDEGMINAKPCNQPAKPHLEPWILATTILGSSMAFIDGTVVNVALPVLQRDLHATTGDVQWIVEAYSLFLSALILVGGSLGDHFGRKRIFGLGVLLFAVSSMACGLSPDVPLLILARAVQGIGGALLVPGSLAIISASFSVDKRGRAIGTWSGFTSITSAIGPVLGGWLVQNASWRWVFFINVPLAVIVLVLLFWRVPESRDEGITKRLDWPGVSLATIGLGALVYGLIQAGQSSLGSPLVLLALAVGIAALISFVVVEARSHSPMLPLNLFRSRTFSGANLLTLFLYAALSGALFFFPFDLIQVQGYDPTAAGAAMLPFILIMFTLSRWSGGLVARYGAKLPLIIGPIIVAAGFALFAVPGLGSGQESYWTTYFPAVVVLGLGMAISVAPLTTAVMGAVDSQRAGIASGVNNAVSRTAGLLAIAVLGIVMLGVFSASLDSRLSSQNVTPTVQRQIDAQKVKLGAITLPKTLPASETASLERAIDEAFVGGFRIVMLCASGLALASSLSAALLIEGKKADRDSAPVKFAAEAVRESR
jgi:EmrB/QacA subfamily drug resistance transporter